MKLSKRLRPNVQAVRLALLAIALVGLLAFQLGSLTPGLAAGEQALPTPRTALQAIVDNPLEAPANALRVGVALFSPENSLGFSRLPSVVLGLVLVAAFYVLVHKWYGERLALFGVVLLMTAPWFLHVSRFAANDILYPLGMLLIMLLAAYWHRKEWRPRLLYGSAVIIAGLAYVPGMLLLVILVAGFEYKRILANVRTFSKHALAATVLGLALVAPLVYGIVNSPALSKQLIGFSADGWPSITAIGAEVLRTWQYIFFGGFEDPARNLAALPIVNILISLLFIVGLSLYARHSTATRTKQLLALWLAGSLLVALQGSVSLTLLLPVVFVLAVGGLGYLLHLWLQTFPRNPFARAFGIGVLSLVIAFAVVYNLRNYYVAWPNTPAVKAAFKRQI